MGLLFRALHVGLWWVFCDWAAVPIPPVTANQPTAIGLMGSGVSCCLTSTENLDSKNKSTRNHRDLTVSVLAQRSERWGCFTPAALSSCGPAPCHRDVGSALVWMGSEGHPA